MEQCSLRLTSCPPFPPPWPTTTVPSQVQRHLHTHITIITKKKPKRFIFTHAVQRFSCPPMGGELELAGWEGSWIHKLQRLMFCCSLLHICMLLCKLRSIICCCFSLLLKPYQVLWFICRHCLCSKPSHRKGKLHQSETLQFIYFLLVLFYMQLLSNCALEADVRAFWFQPASGTLSPNIKQIFSVQENTFTHK